MTTQQHYGLKKTVAMSYDGAVEKITAALKEEGFGIMTEVNVKDTLKTKLDVDFKRYVILGACKPQLAYRALQEDEEVGLLLPCNVIVYEVDEESTTVSIAHPHVVLGVANNAELLKIADEALSSLEKALDSI